MFYINKQKYLDLSILIVAFSISRILFLFFTPYSFYNEEAKIGSLGHDIIFEKGLKIPFWGYLDSPHSGGSIFSGLAAIPFYIIFGDKYLALKITALVFSILALIFWYIVLLSVTNNSRKTFIFSLFLFTFATPHYVQKSVILAGNIVEPIFFNALTVYYFLKLRNSSFMSRKYLILGMLCGFSFWIQFMSFYLFLAIILFSFITERFKIAFTQSIYLLIGFFIGAFPLWIYNFIYQWPTLTADTRVPLYVLFNLHKLKNFLFIDLPASFHFLDIGNVRAQYLSFIIYGAFILAVLIHLSRNLINYVKTRNQGLNHPNTRNKLEIFLIFYLFIFTVFVAFTTAPIRSNNAYGWNSMNVHAEYYIISLQPLIFVLFILLNKYKSKFIFSINTIVSIIFILGYNSLFSMPYDSSRLMKPMHVTESNTYECGFNFVKNPALFLKFRQNISKTLQESYMKGAKDFWEKAPIKTKKQILEKAEKLGLDYALQYPDL